MKKVLLLTLCGTLMFSAGVLASDFYLKWVGSTNLSNSENSVENYVRDVNEYITNAKNAIEKLKERVSSLETTKSELEEQLATETDKNDTLNTTINTLNEEIKSLNIEITSLETEIARLGNENIDLKDQIEILEGSLEDQEVANEKIQGLTEELTKANADATQHEQNINSIINNSIELDDSIFPFVFNAQNFVVNTNSSTVLKEQTENSLVFRPKYTISGTMDCLFIANYDGLRVGKKYKLLLRVSANVGDSLIVTNGTNRFIPSDSTRLIEEEFVAEDENLQLKVSKVIPCDSLAEYRISNISLIECE